MNTYRNNARQVLAANFRLLFLQAGLPWDNDNEADMHAIVDLLIKAAVQEMREQEPARFSGEAE
jgi:hypothetical protein